MFTLTLDRGKFLRVRGNVSKRDIEKEFKMPVPQNVIAGDIVMLFPRNLKVYVAGVGENYGAIAEKTGVTEQELRKINYNATVYPTLKIYYLPEKF